MRRERFPRHRLQRKPSVSDPGMHHGTWCMSGSLTHGDGKTFPVLPAHAQPAILRVSDKRPIGWLLSGAKLIIDDVTFDLWLIWKDKTPIAHSTQSSFRGTKEHLVRPPDKFQSDWTIVATSRITTKFFRILKWCPLLPHCVKHVRFVFLNVSVFPYVFHRLRYSALAALYVLC